jgi:type IV pilus assembly protein PilE
MEHTRSRDIDSRQLGFTLIEVIVTVAIVGILASIALPSYQQYVVRSNRSAVQQFMLDIANRQEQFMLDVRSYTTTVGAGGLNMPTPPEVTGKYTLAVTLPGVLCAGQALTPPGYCINATPVVGGMQATDGNLTLDSLGRKTPPDKWK